MSLPERDLYGTLKEADDFALWQYYGTGFLSQAQNWIFQSRIEILIDFLRKLELRLKTALDVGCGPMLVSYPLVKSGIAREYIGIDIAPLDHLQKYKKIMKSADVENIEVIRASANHLPFRKKVFDLVTSLDVLEHLKTPNEAAVEINSVAKMGGLIAISLPLENFFQRILRIGFKVMPFFGTPKCMVAPMKIQAVYAPEFHYTGNIKNYAEMKKMLSAIFDWHCTVYTPVGYLKSININAILIFQNSSQSHVLGF